MNINKIRCMILLVLQLKGLTKKLEKGFMITYISLLLVTGTCDYNQNILYILIIKFL